ncbi:MAG: ROK family protein [Microbacterium sp.]
MTIPPLGSGHPVLAFDIGGTDIKSALFDADGTALSLTRTPTPEPGENIAERVIDEVARLADDLRTAHPTIQPWAAGLVVAGLVDAANGIGIFSSNLGWRDAPLKRMAAEQLALPIAFDHDVRAAAWAEHELGGAHGYDGAVVLIIGTGISGAIFVDGRPYAAGGWAGEFGHSPVADGPVCACGARGCLEAVASAGAIVRGYAERTGETPDGAEDVIARATSGDTAAREIWDAALDALTLSLAQITASLAPEAIVIGGGLSRAGAGLFDELTTRLDARLSFHRRPAILPARLQGDAGVLGAALRAREVA